MKIGLDLHGVCDLYAESFREMSSNLMMNKHEVHIITGMPWKDAKKEVKNLGISFSRYFSIIDYHKKIGTRMWKDDRGGWCVEEKLWVRAKGDYIHRQKIDVHFDDSYEYAEYCPSFCTYILVPKTNFNAWSRLVYNGFTLW